jgi:hypothetical protein
MSSAPTSGPRFLRRTGQCCNVLPTSRRLLEVCDESPNRLVPLGAVATLMKKLLTIHRDVIYLLIYFFYFIYCSELNSMLHFVAVKPLPQDLHQSLQYIIEYLFVYYIPLLLKYIHKLAQAGHKCILYHKWMSKETDTLNNWPFTDPHFRI